MPGTDNQIIGSKLFSNDDYQERMRLYGQQEDAFRFFTMWKKYDISLLRVISEKFGRVPGDQITDFELKYPEASEMDYIYTPYATSTDDDTTKKSSIPFKNDVASDMHINMIVAVQPDLATGIGMWMDSPGATLATTMSSTTPLPETLLVEYIDNPDSYASGYANVIFKRMYPVDSPAATLLPITTSMKLVIANNIAAEDSMPYPPSTKNQGEQITYIQTTRESYGISSHVLSGIKTYLNTDQLEYNLELCSGRVMFEIEAGLLMGRLSKKKRNGKMLYQTGGYLEFFDSANILDFNAVITTINFKNQIKAIGDTVGNAVSEFWGFCGTTAMNKLENAFDGKIGLEPAERESLRYGIKVKEFTAHATNTRIFLATAPILNVFGMDNEIHLLNLSDKYKCFQIGEKEKLEDRPKDKDSLSPEGQYSKWRELYSMWGLARRLAKSHFRIYDFK